MGGHSITRLKQRGFEVDSTTSRRLVGPGCKIIGDPEECALFITHPQKHFFVSPEKVMWCYGIDLNELTTLCLWGAPFFRHIWEESNRHTLFFLPRDFDNWLFEVELGREEYMSYERKVFMDLVWKCILFLPDGFRESGENTAKWFANHGWEL
jgi:hypothetical protein